MTTKRFLLGFLLVSLLIAGVASYYASSHPDGLNYVAATNKFDHRAEKPLTADSPLAHYSVTGVKNQRLSGGLAGIAGVAVVLTLSTGLFFVLRRRSSGTVPEETTTT